MGVHNGQAVYLLYNGVLGDRRPAGGNVLTGAVSARLPPHPAGRGPRVVYGEACRLARPPYAARMYLPPDAISPWVFIAIDLTGG